MAKLTAKQKTFVEEYLVDLNATQAAIRAGYSAKTANEQGSRLLANVKVREAVQEAMDKRSVRTEITADNVLHEIAKLAFSNMMDYITVLPDGMATIDLSMLTRDQAAAIQEMTVDVLKQHGDDEGHVQRVRFKLADKKGNLELLARNLKLLTDKVEVDAGSLIDLVKAAAEKQ